MSNLLHFFKTAGLLKKVKRTGWVLKGVKNAESIADHTFAVALMCMLLSDKKKLKITKLLQMALIHDLGEAIIGDIPKTGKHRSKESITKKLQLEEEALRQIFSLTSEPQKYLFLWQEYRKQKSAEAIFLKQIDKLEMALQASEYRTSGIAATKLKEFFNDAETYIKDQTLKQIFTEIKTNE